MNMASMRQLSIAGKEETQGKPQGPRLGKHDWKEDCESSYLAKDQGRKLLNAFRDKKTIEK